MIKATFTMHGRLAASAATRLTHTPRPELAAYTVYTKIVLVMSLHVSTAQVC